MNKLILDTVIQNFINENLYTDIASVLLKGHAFKDVTIQEVVEQIESKKKSQFKLPTWFNYDSILYPNKLNIEQTSSETTAKLKSEIISGQSLLDLTMGFGVDLYYFSKSFRSVVGCEKNRELFSITEHNYKELGISNAILYNIDGLEYIKTTKETFDWVFIDPSRRHDIKGKIFRFRDSEPNVLEHMDSIFSVTSKILIKSSPLIDISMGISELRNVSEIFIVSVKNEVKELLWLLQSNKSPQSTNITCIDIRKEAVQRFNFIFEEEERACVNFSKPLSYLYEPNAAIMKSGGFKSISERFNLSKLHRHSHLYTSDELIDFPGRIFEIKSILPFKSKLLKRELPKKANITTRNFSITVSEIKKKFKISDGGKEYLFFTTNLDDEKIVLNCVKV